MEIMLALAQAIEDAGIAAIYLEPQITEEWLALCGSRVKLSPPTIRVLYGDMFWPVYLRLDINTAILNCSAATGGVVSFDLADPGSVDAIIGFLSDVEVIAQWRTRESQIWDNLGESEFWNRHNAIR